MNKLWIHAVFSAVIFAAAPAFTAFGDEKREALGPEDLVQAVLTGNHRLRAQRLDTAAMERRSEGAGTWENPMLMYGVAPLMLAEGDWTGAHQVEISQTIPWPGKSGIEKQMADNEAALKQIAAQGTAQELATQARLLFAERVELFLVRDALNEELDRLDELQKYALAEISSGKANQADALMIEMELHMVHEREISNSANLSRINAEIDRLAAADIAARLEPVLPAFSAPATEAAAQTPEVRMAALDAAGADLERRLAAKNQYPDITLFAGVNTMWMEESQWPMIGVRLELPVRGAKSRAAEAASEQSLAARERLAEASNERRAMAAKATAMRDEAGQLSRLYAETSVPLAARRLASAKAAYGNGQTEIGEVVQALRAKIQTDLMRKRLTVMGYKAEAELALAHGTALSAREGVQP